MISSSDILKASILIVDDQDANVSLLEEMLHRAGYVSVSSTKNPHEVCDLHRKNRYCLILLDLQMPGLDGFQVMEGLKKIETEGYLPVLAQTSQPGHKLRALKAGAKDFISKPFDLEEVLLRVHNLLEVRLLHREAEMRTEQVEERGEQRESLSLVKLEEKNFELKGTIEALERAHGRIVELNRDLERRVAERTAELEGANRGLEKKNHEIQNFYHTLSHELKTPLTSTREFIALVADGVAGAVNESQTEYLGLAIEGCDQLTVCINDLLDATRLETGKMAIQLKPGSLGQVVKRVLAGLKNTAAEKMISLQEDVTRDLPDVLMDDARMSQIITNLVNNALKFTPSNGRVGVSVRESKSHPQFLEVSVRDTGRGIAKDQLDLIFDRLYQIKNGDAATEQGVGLGLYLCRELVGLHGGDIRVESELGKGSTFTFTIPEPGALRRPRVLVIEDDPELSASTRRILEGGGFEAFTASTGEEGLQLLEECDPMAAVIDLHMPGLDGAEILREIRQRYGAVPVVVYTGDPEGELMTRALEFSPFTVLAKPCSADRLLKTLRGLKGQADTQFWRRCRIEGNAKRHVRALERENVLLRDL
jgi:signal transduction histidine kinase